MINKPNIFLVDDHDLFRDGLKTLFELSGLAKVTGEASNGMEFLNLLNSNTPDLVLIDIDMPIMNGIEATEAAIKKYPGLKILVLSMFNEYKYYSKMIEAGVKGFLLKSANKNELETAISKVSSGHTYFSKELLQDMMLNINNSSGAKTKDKQSVLTKKEKEIIKYLCHGLSTEEIAQKVFLSAKTVSNYRNIMLQKTGCKNSTHLIFHAIKTGLVNV